MKPELKPGYIDVHCHLAEAAFGGELDEVVERAQAAGITNFMQGGIGPEDWDRQDQLVGEGIIRCFGLHPYWIAAHDSTECEEAFHKLKLRVFDTAFLGEMGLDFRDKYLEERPREHQIQYFKAQLRLALRYKKAPVLHVVRAHPEAQLILQGMARPFLVHSFNSSWEIASKYLDLGALLSIGGPLCRSRNTALHEAVRQIPAQSILIESDSPDQAPEGWEGKFNEPSSILLVAKRISELKGGTAEQWLEQSRENFQRLLATTD